MATYTLYDGTQADRDDYIRALRTAWLVYGALVANGHIPAYNFEGSEDQQIVKFNHILHCVEDIAGVLAPLHGDSFEVNGAVWEQENLPDSWTYPRQTDKPNPIEDDGLPSVTEEKLIDSVLDTLESMKAKPPKKKGRPEGRKRRKSGTK